MNNIDSRLIDLNEQLIKLKRTRIAPTDDVLKQAERVIAGETVGPVINTGAGDDTVIINQIVEPPPPPPPAPCDCQQCCGNISPDPTPRCTVSTHVIDDDYTATTDDCFIGAIKKGITITLPVGSENKVYYIKNMTNGNITVQPTDPDTIDSGSPATIKLGTDNFLILIFSHGRWNIVSQ